jgi:ferrous iron transport protein B
VAVLTSFLAREVFVGTLGTLYGIEAAEENLLGLTERLQQSGLGIAGALSLAVFYALAMQCVSTLAVIKKETGSVKTPVLIFLGMTLLAYIAASLSFFIFSAILQ